MKKITTGLVVLTLLISGIALLDSAASSLKYHQYLYQTQGRTDIQYRDISVLPFRPTGRPPYQGLANKTIQAVPTRETVKAQVNNLRPRGKTIAQVQASTRTSTGVRRPFSSRYTPSPRPATTPARQVIVMPSRTQALEASQIITDMLQATDTDAPRVARVPAPTFPVEPQVVGQVGPVSSTYTNSDFSLRLPAGFTKQSTEINQTLFSNGVIDLTVRRFPEGCGSQTFGTCIDNLQTQLELMGDMEGGTTIFEGTQYRDTLMGNFDIQTATHQVSTLYQDRFVARYFVGNLDNTVMLVEFSSPLGHRSTIVELAAEVFNSFRLLTQAAEVLTDEETSGLTDDIQTTDTDDTVVTDTDDTTDDPADQN